MTSFLGRKDVEQCAVAAVHAAMIFLLKGDLATDMHAAHELAGPMSTFRSHAYEWLQVLHVFYMHFYPVSYVSRCMQRSCSTTQQRVAVQVLQTLPPDTVKAVLREHSIH